MFLTISYSTDSAFSLKALLPKKAATERVTKRDDKRFLRTQASMDRKQEKMEIVEIVLFDRNMLLNRSEASEALDGRKALPSKQLISTLCSVTNGFLFSTTPIVLRILESICGDVRVFAA